MYSKNVTVRGNSQGMATQLHVFMDVPVGISVGELIEMAGGLDKDDSVGEIIMGGAFTGRAAELDEPTTKTTGAILQHIECLTLQIRKLVFLSVHAAVMKLVCVQLLRRCMEKLFLYGLQV